MALIPIKDMSAILYVIKKRRKMMLLDKLNASRGGFGTDLGETRGKTIGEFSNDEWEKLLGKVDNAIEDYKEDLKEREEDAKEKQKKQAEENVYNARNKSDYEYEQTVMRGGALYSMRFQKINSGMFSAEETKAEKPDVEDSVSDFISQEAIQKIVGNRGKMPYASLADENGIIEYNGVRFVGDLENNALCLGDMTDYNNILNIPLSKGGVLKVNIDSLEDLSKAIGMFSPEDQNRIMRAIAQYNRIQQIKQQIDDETSGLEVLEKNDDVIYFA